jgi:hypothetical protein
VHFVPAQSDRSPNHSPELESHLPDLSKQLSGSAVPHSVINVDDAFVVLPTMPEVPQPELDDQKAPSDALSLSTEAVQHSQRTFEDHANPDEHISCQADSRLTFQESPIDPRKSHGIEPRVAAVSLELPTLASHVTPLQNKSDRQSTPQPSAIASTGCTAVPSDRASTAGVDLPISQDSVVSLPRMPLQFKLT